MVKKSKNNNLGLPDSTIIEVVKINKNNGDVKIKKMTVGDWKLLVRQKSFYYTAYQENYSQFNIKK